MSSPDQSAPDPSLPTDPPPVEPPHATPYPQPVRFPPDAGVYDPGHDTGGHDPGHDAGGHDTGHDARNYDPGHDVGGHEADLHGAGDDRGGVQEGATVGGYGYGGATSEGYASDGYSADWPREPAPSRSRQILIPVAVVVAVAALGVAVGWLWAVVSPRVPVVKGDGGRYYYGAAEPEQAVAGDGWFLIVGIVLGLVLAIAAWLVLRRYRGIVMIVALGLGSILGAWVAWLVGHKIGMTEFTRAAANAPVNAHLNAPLQLAMTNMDPHRWWFPGLTGVLAGQALAAVLVYTVLAGFSAYEDLGTRRPLAAGPDPSSYPD